MIMVEYKINIHKYNREHIFSKYNKEHIFSKDNREHMQMQLQFMAEFQ